MDSSKYIAKLLGAAAYFSGVLEQNYWKIILLTAVLDMSGLKDDITLIRLKMSNANAKLYIYIFYFQDVKRRFQVHFFK
jgi:hypothetical protein